MPMIVLLVFALIIALALGPLILIFGYLRSRQRNISKEEVEALRAELHELRTEIDDLKEEFADFIISS